MGGDEAARSEVTGESCRKREICVNIRVALDVIVRSVFVTFLAPVRLERINKTLPDVTALSHDDIKRHSSERGVTSPLSSLPPSITSPPLVRRQNFAHKSSERTSISTRSSRPLQKRENRYARLD